MSHLAISYSLNADARNWLRIWLKNESIYGLSQKNLIDFIPPELQKALLNKKESQQLVLIKDYLKKQKTMNQFLKLEAIALQMVWDKFDLSFVKSLVKVTGKPMCADRFSVQLTSASLSPYDEKNHWFMVNGRHSIGIQITVIAHELMHLQFIYWYKEMCMSAKLTPSQFEDLKEALTVLLNENEFKNIIVSPDHGYPKHKELREKIQKVWRKRFMFDLFLKKIIVLIKKETLM